MLDYLVQFDPLMAKGMATSMLLIAVLWTIRAVLIRAVHRRSEIRSEILSTDQRRWTQMIKTLIWVLIILGLIMIWAPQLHTAALSLTAFVVAIVIATKEVILCFMGAFMRVSTAPYRMGDWITIDNITGEVVDINPFSAKVQELEVANGTYAFTGKIIQIPNSRYFIFPIENLSHMKQFKSHLFTIGFQNDSLSPAQLLKKLQAIVKKHTKHCREEAASVVKRVKRKSHIPLPDPAPQILINAKDFNNIDFSIRIYVPTTEAASIASAITVEFMDEVSKLKLLERKDEKKWARET